MHHLNRKSWANSYVNKYNQTFKFEAVIISIMIVFVIVVLLKLI